MKNWYQSKTVWFSVFTGILGALQAIQTLNLDSQVMGYITLGIGFVSFLLRTITSDPINISKEEI